MDSYVLFVDDEPENLVVFEAACADRFPVLTAGSAEEGLRLMRCHEVAVLIADQRMPGATGLDLLERAQAEYPRTVRMLITAYSDLSTAIEAINRGRVRRYLKKPWDAQELCATLAEGVDVYRMGLKLCALERRLRETERVYALGVITSGLARELKKPVAAMRATIGRAQELVHGVTLSLPGDVSGKSQLRARLVEAEDELAELQICAGRLLDVVRGVELPTTQSETRNVDISEVVRLTLRLMQSEIRESTSLELDVKPAPEVRGSLAEVGQVVLNLLVNALDALANTPRANRKLSVRISYEAPWVRLEVADTGPGIAAERLPHVFEPLAFLGQSGSAGLGLAIAKSIVDGLGGTLEAENRASGGTRFRLGLRASESS